MGGVGAATATPQPSQPQYKVGVNGETLYDIAKRTLGTGDKWWLIADLNKGYNNGTTPACGTVLRLPAGAGVPLQNQ